MCFCVTTVCRNTGHDVLHCVEWASASINSTERNQIWRTGGGSWWDHTYPYVCTHRTCAQTHTKDLNLRRGRCSQTDIMQTRRQTSRRNSRKEAETESRNRLNTYVTQMRRGVKWHRGDYLERSLLLGGWWWQDGGTGANISSDVFGEQNKLSDNMWCIYVSYSLAVIQGHHYINNMSNGNTSV